MENVETITCQQFDQYRKVSKRTRYLQFEYWLNPLYIFMGSGMVGWGVETGSFILAGLAGLGTIGIICKYSIDGSNYRSAKKELSGLEQELNTESA